MVEIEGFFNTTIGLIILSILYAVLFTFGAILTIQIGTIRKGQYKGTPENKRRIKIGAAVYWGTLLALFVGYIVMIENPEISIIIFRVLFWGLFGIIAFIYFLNLFIAIINKIRIKKEDIKFEDKIIKNIESTKKDYYRYINNIICISSIIIQIYLLTIDVTSTTWIITLLGTIVFIVSLFGFKYEINVKNNILKYRHTIFTGNLIIKIPISKILQIKYDYNLTYRSRNLIIVLNLDYIIQADIFNAWITEDIVNEIKEIINKRDSETKYIIEYASNRKKELKGIEKEKEEKFQIKSIEDVIKERQILKGIKIKNNIIPFLITATFFTFSFLNIVEFYNFDIAIIFLIIPIFFQPLKIVLYNDRIEYSHIIYTLGRKKVIYLQDIIDIGVNNFKTEEESEVISVLKSITKKSLTEFTESLFVKVQTMNNGMVYIPLIFKDSKSANYIIGYVKELIEDRRRKKYE